MIRRGKVIRIFLTEWRYRVLLRSMKGKGNPQAEVQNMVDEILDRTEPRTPEEDYASMLTPGAPPGDVLFEKAVLSQISDATDKSVEEVTREMKERGFYAGNGWSDERMWRRISRMLIMLGYRKYRASADATGNRLWRYRRHKGTLSGSER